MSHFVLYLSRKRDFPTVHSFQKMTPSSEFNLKMEIFGDFDWLKVHKAPSYDQYWYEAKKNLTPPFCANRIKQGGSNIAGHRIFSSYGVCKVLQIK